MKIKSITPELREVIDFIDNGERSEEQKKDIVHAMVDYFTYIVMTLPIKSRFEVVKEILFKKGNFDNITFEKGDKEK